MLLGKLPYLNVWSMSKYQLVVFVGPAAMDIADIVHMVERLNELGVVKVQRFSAWINERLKRPIVGA